MKVLVIGSGGREHALVWKFKQDPEVSEIFCAPGNPGMEGVNLVNITDYNDIANFAEKQNIDLTVVGPEVPLCDGIVDIFREKDLLIFGPSKMAAQLEGSKDYSKDFMFKYNIPTAQSRTFTNEEEALKYLESSSAPIVIKADGLAAGKGVTVALTMEEALSAVKNCFSGTFGQAGYKVIIEDFLDGEEASIFAFLDGEVIKPLASSQDHKRAYENDKGPNTGGMGAYSPAPVITDHLMQRIESEILQPILKGMKEEGLDYRGVIFVGVMITSSGPKVLEFNVRFGDPETQAVLVRMKSSLFEAIIKTVKRELSSFEFKWFDASSCCVVMASGGYPYSYEKGFQIKGLKEAQDIAGVSVFHAGTSLNGMNQLTNTGGRVLGIAAKGSSIQEAVDLAYQGVEKIYWKDCFYRKDIAYRALN